MLASTLSAWKSIDERSWAWAGLSLVTGVAAVQFKLPAVAAAALPVVMLATCRDGWASRAAYAAACAAGPVMSYRGLMMSPLGTNLRVNNADVQRTPSFDLVRDNLATLADSILSYMPGGLWLLAIAGGVLLVRARPRTALVLLAAIGIWSLPWILIRRFTPSRWYTPTIPFVCVLAAFALIAIPTLLRERNEEAGVAAATVSAMLVAYSLFCAGWLAVAQSTATLSKQGVSITGGDYLQEPETFPRQVEHKSWQTDRPVETINSAVGAINMANELAILEETGLSPDPDVVVLCFYLNDFQASFGFKVGRLPSWLHGSSLAWLVLRSLDVAHVELETRSGLHSSSVSSLRTELDEQLHPAPGDPLKDRRAFYDASAAAGG